MPLFDRQLTLCIEPFVSFHSRELEARMKALPAPFDAMNAFLERYHAVLCGSFITRTLFPNDTWNNQDIDIFLSKRFHDQVMALIVYDPHWLPDCDTDEYENDDIFRSRRRTRDQTNFNFIFYHVETQEEVTQQIFRHFDIDGCTMQWNGRQWMWCPEMELRNYWNRQWKYRIAPNHVTERRIAKYQARGFDITSIQG